MVMYAQIRRMFFREHCSISEIARRTSLTRNNADRLIEYLDRLADVSPQNVGDILESLLNAFQPMFDFEDHLKSILRKLAQHNLRAKALALTDKLRMLNGMPELFEELTHPAAHV